MFQAIPFYSKRGIHNWLSDLVKALVNCYRSRKKKILTVSGQGGARGDARTRPIVCRYFPRR